MCVCVVYSRVPIFFIHGFRSCLFLAVGVSNMSSISEFKMSGSLK